MFNFETHNVRTVVNDDGEVWFVVKDVCEALAISNHHDALIRLDDDEKDAVGITDTIGKTQQNSIISESGLYKLAFISRKEKAKRFTKWVTSEVLPTIRETGKYKVPVSNVSMSEINFYNVHFIFMAQKKPPFLKAVGAKESNDRGEVRSELKLCVVRDG